MSTYEQRLEQDMNQIAANVKKIAGDVETAIANAVKALIDRDNVLAYQTILNDNPINRDVQNVTEECHFFVARHLPSAGHLRYISSVLRMGIGLERLGDYACTICREAVQLRGPLAPALAEHVVKVADEARAMLHRAVVSFKDADVELARETMGLAYQVNRDFDSIFEKITNKEDDGSGLHDLMGVLVIFNNLERVSDQAKNICEETVFAVTGETKQRKPVSTLFLNTTDDIVGPMARAIGAKAFAKTGRFISAGNQPAGKIDPRVVAFMSKRGYDMGGYKPGNLEWLPTRVREFKVIISLEGPVSDYVERMPFHAVALDWVLPQPPAADASAEDADAALEAIYKELVVRIRDLMTIYRGEEAC